MADFAIVLLAAGNSSRMGQPKQLLDFGGKTLIRIAAEAALASRCSPVVVVCGEREAEIRHALASLPVLFAPNPEWAAGIGTSIRAGLSALRSQPVAGALLTLADLPLLTADSYNRLLDTHRATGKTIIASAYSGTVGVPVLFTSQYFPPLLALAPHQGCKGVILAHPEDTCPLPCPEAEADVDTPADYARALTARTSRAATPQTPDATPPACS